MAVQIILYRDRMAGKWLATHKGETVRDDVTHDTEFSSAEKAGDVVAQFKRANPGSQIGVKADELGLAVQAACLAQGYGNILWMR